jgi:hypothetical protein
MNDKKLIYSIVGIFALLVLISGIGGYFYGLKVGYVSGKSVSEKEITDLKAGLRIYSLPSPSEIFSISGVIKEIGENTIKVETNSFTDFPPLPGQKISTELRLVEVTSETEITESVFFKPRLPVSGKNGQSSGAQAKEIKLSDLKIGDNITIRSSENIKNKMKFAAMSIEKISMMPPPLRVEEMKIPPLSFKKI